MTCATWCQTSVTKVMPADDMATRAAAGPRAHDAVEGVWQTLHWVLLRYFVERNSTYKGTQKQLTWLRERDPGGVRMTPLEVYTRLYNEFRRYPCVMYSIKQQKGGDSS